MRVPLYSYSTITGWGVLLRYRYGIGFKDVTGVTPKMENHMENAAENETEAN